LRGSPQKNSRKKTRDFFSRDLGSIGQKISRKNSRNVILEKSKSRDFLSIGQALTFHVYYLWPVRASILDVCFAVRTFVPKFPFYRMGKKQEFPVPLWEKFIGLLIFRKIFSPIFCLIEIISVILFIWEKNHCQMVNIHLYVRNIH
jgi:hypothetical protein